jgi:hypothetical protein
MTTCSSTTVGTALRTKETALASMRSLSGFMVSLGSNNPS